MPPLLHLCAQVCIKTVTTKVGPSVPSSCT